jgi:hypothetical protein
MAVRLFLIIVLYTVLSMGAAAQVNEFRDRLLPAPMDGGFRMDGYWVWCGSVIKGDDGKYHMFASRWPKTTGFGPYWLTNSEIVHAVSDKPAGPYKFSDIALPPRGSEFWDGQMTHNPAIRKYKGTYLLYYTGTTNKRGIAFKDRGSSTRTHWTSDIEIALRAVETTRQADPGCPPKFVGAISRQQRRPCRTRERKGAALLQRRGTSYGSCHWLGRR